MEGSTAKREKELPQGLKGKPLLVPLSGALRPVKAKRAHEVIEARARAFKRDGSLHFQAVVISKIQDFSLRKCD